MLSFLNNLIIYKKIISFNDKNNKNIMKQRIIKLFYKIVSYLHIKLKIMEFL